MQQYVELHCHSCFSFREGASTPLELVMAARLLGYPALALTDHDNLAGAMEFSQTAKAWDLRPIIGAEVTLADGSIGRLGLEGRGITGADGYHLTLLAETPRGYANLSRLLSRANLASPRGQPRVRSEWLAEHAEGVIALSGCRKGEVARLVEAGESRAARRAAERLRSIFGRESCFIELQDNLAYEDFERNQGLVALARDLGLQVVATNNVHYHERARHRLHDVLSAVRLRLTLEEARPYLRPNSEFYLKPASYMTRLFDGLPEAVENTLRIAARCTGEALTTGRHAGGQAGTETTVYVPAVVAAAGRVAEAGSVYGLGSVAVALDAAHASRPAPLSVIEEDDGGTPPISPGRGEPLHSRDGLDAAVATRHPADGSQPPCAGIQPPEPASPSPRTERGTEGVRSAEDSLRRLTVGWGAIPGGRWGEYLPPGRRAIPAPLSRGGQEGAGDPLTPTLSLEGEGVNGPTLTGLRSPILPAPEGVQSHRPGIQPPEPASPSRTQTETEGVRHPGLVWTARPRAMREGAQASPAASEGQSRLRSGFDLKRDLSYVFPDYEAEDGRSADEFLRDLCYTKAREWYGTPLPEDVEIRLRQELDLVRRGKRAGFFLRLWEIMEFAHRNNLPARGRGSSVGSVVCFLLGLSGIDPMKYDLVVERFLNEDRLEEDVPDIDIDLGRVARDSMFRHIFDKYSTAHAAMVCNFIEYRYASAIRDVGKALGLAQGEIDKVAKRMRSRFAGRLGAELEALPEFAARLRFPIWQDFVELVEQLRGMPRHLSQHSGGMIISTTRIDEQVPVEATAMDGRYICQWDKDSVADAGFIKLDLLGYPSLDQLERGLRYVRERHGKAFRSQDIELSDPEVYRMVQRGDVLGIVQIQSRAQIQVLLRIKVSRIEDLIIQVALIRPGPIQGGAVHPYIARCLGQEPVTYDHPSLEPALKETKGVFVFQEQVIQAAMAIAGFTSGQAEALRRAMSRKRSREAMEALHQEFLNGAAARGIDPRIAATVYEKIMAFASFGFPKSHAAAMAETAYRVAWLKRYYPVEFYCALLNEQPMGFYSPEVIANDARRHGIEVRGIDVNRSRSECTIESDTALRLGYKYLKGLGEAAWKRLDEEIERGPYRSLRDFWRRSRLGREAIENLIRAGAFAWTGLHERELLWQLGTFYRPLGAQLPLELEMGDAQPPSAAGGSLPRLREMTHHERVLADLLLMGLAVRGRSMDLVAGSLPRGVTPSNRLEALRQGARVTVAGLVAVRQSPETAKGFVFHTLEDYHGLMNVITRPTLIKRFRWLIESAPALIVHGHIERQERSINVIAERFEPLPAIPDLERRVHSFG